MLKAIFCIIMCGLFTMAAKLSGFDNARYICALVFGYVLYRIWGEDGRPNDQLYYFFMIIEPFLFGCIGAQLLFSKIKVATVWKAVIIILVGVSIRAITAFTVSTGKKYTLKERIFIAICWIPKATVQATVSGQFLAQAKSVKN